ncbi:pyridoxal phosphate-dependent aminotransferase [Oceanobacillus alkalisoli]|uniref:pyridoxal phosphate-dependent aminotransferase n=1 Tax=Oceanobacillus alkalisoli TaxID=2925113 RepID=UPI001EE49E5A|nr:pyridoxal phosphate-dependent aminotransferase [Oceanobacillus alkalisoli]MCG5102897.1 pyridoxal phosphate-dependent aminotransferase [Oceanobacillus alkalisoli]
MELANRVKTITPSSTLAITAKANELKSKGHDVIGLGAGEPDFNTPEPIMEAAIQAMQAGFTKYTPTGGIPQLIEAIQKKMERDHQLTYSKEEIIVTMGAKHALYALFQVLLNKGDEVLIPAPYWVSYPEQVKLAEGVPVFIHTKEEYNFKVHPEDLEKAITNKTKAIIINSPSNPTGMMYSEEELEKLGEIALKHNILIVSDEIYEKLIYSEEEHVSIASISPELKKQTVVINGVSKTYAMTGWRIGYATGEKQIIKAMNNVSSHSTSNPVSIAQHASVAALSIDESEIRKMRDIFAERLDVFYTLISEIPGITCEKPKGAFYLFPNVIEAVRNNGFDTVDEWVTAILEDEKVAMVPGTGFGAPDNVRLSYCISMDDLTEAAKRIKRFVETH